MFKYKTDSESEGESQTDSCCEPNGNVEEATNPEALLDTQVSVLKRFHTGKRMVTSLSIMLILIGMSFIGAISIGSNPSSMNNAHGLQPTIESDVLTQIPPEGVQIGSWILTPSSSLSTSSKYIRNQSAGGSALGTFISKVQAIINATGWTAALVGSLENKIQVTPAAFSIPGIVRDQGLNVMNNPSVWIVTVPITPELNPLLAVGTMQSGIPGPRPKIPMVSHINYAVDAKTGVVLSEAWTQ